MTSPSCRSVVVAGAVGGVAVRGGRAAVVATAIAAAVVTTAPVGAVAPLLPLPVPPTGLGISVSLSLVDAVSKVGVAVAVIGSHGVAAGHGMAVGNHGIRDGQAAPIRSWLQFDPQSFEGPAPSLQKKMGAEKLQLPLRGKK